jgi:putative transposase
MPKKTYRPEEIIAKLRQAEVLPGEGKKVPEVVRTLGVHEVTYYRWRKEYDGLQVSQAKRLKELERENVRLGKAVSDPDSEDDYPGDGTDWDCHTGTAATVARLAAVIPVAHRIWETLKDSRPRSLGSPCVRVLREETPS